MKLTLREDDPFSPTAIVLVDELSDALRRITGSDGSASFEPESVGTKGGCFLVVWSGDEPIGCGALRSQPEPGVAEIKRMYARHPHKGIGSTLLHGLERRAVHGSNRRGLHEKGGDG